VYMSQEAVRANRKVRKGVVVSNKMQKTVVVNVSWTVSHPRYGKVINKSLKCYAHNDFDEIKEGDEVLIMETRPLSKTKRWRVVEKCVRA
jgi:small subunit ribosomal protein S17